MHPAPIDDTRPTRRRSFVVVLAIELWERFGFYGMQAILLLYLVEKIGLSDQHATLLIGAFSALTYIFPVLGGLAGDRVLGARRCMAMGAILLSLGYLVLAFVDGHRAVLAPALALIATGNGLFKPNAGAIVRKIYEGKDADLDAAFTIYYMSVNVGSTVSMLLTPWLQEKFGPAIAFLVCSMGLCLGISYYFVHRARLAIYDGPHDRRPVALSLAVMVGAAIALCLFLAMEILGHEALAKYSVWGAAGLIVIAWTWLYRHVATAERIGLRIAYLLCSETMVYALFYQQQQTSLTLLALRGVDGDFSVGGLRLFHLSAGQFQALDPMWIMAMSPVLAWAYAFFARRRVDLSLAMKIAIGLGMGAAAFLLWWASAARAQGLMSGWSMLFGYGFSSLGELLTMALGLAVISRYVPERFSGFMMGSLYLLWALAFYIGSILANLGTQGTGDAPVLQGAQAYVPLLRDLALMSTLACCAAFALLPLLRRWERCFSPQS